MQNNQTQINPSVNLSNKTIIPSEVEGSSEYSSSEVEKSRMKQAEIGLSACNAQAEPIPEDWEVLKLGDAIDFVPQRIIKKGQEVKFVAMTDIDPSDKQIKGFSNRKFNGGSKFKNGDTLMARITPCLENGKTAFCNVLNDDEIAGGSTELIVLSGKEGKSDSNFVYYLMISPEIRDIAIQAMAGTFGRRILR